MRLKGTVIFLMMCGLLLTGCGNEAKESNNSSLPEKSTVPQQKEVDVSVLTDKNVQHSISEGILANDCSSYKKMEEQSDMIIYGKKTREYFSKAMEESGEQILMAEVEIDATIKAAGASYQKGNKIIVSEGISYYPDYNKVFHLDGYQKMDVGKKYYLMLGKVYPEKEGPDSPYYIIGGTYGKIPEDENEKILFESAECKVPQEDKERADKWIRRNRKELVKR